VESKAPRGYRLQLLLSALGNGPRVQFRNAAAADPAAPATARELDANERDELAARGFDAPRPAPSVPEAFGDVLSAETLSWAGTSSASLLSSMGRMSEVRPSITMAMQRRMAILQAGSSAREALTRARPPARGRNLKQVLGCSEALIRRAWLTSSESDFELAETALGAALNDADQPMDRLRCLVALTRCHELHGASAGDLTDWELASVMANRAFELALTMGSPDGATALDPPPGPATTLFIEAALTLANQAVSKAEMLPGLRAQFLDEADRLLAVVRGLLELKPGLRLLLRRQMLRFSRAGALERRFLILAGREGLTRYGLDGDPEHLRYAIEMANLARILSSRLSDQEDWSTSSYLLARCISYLGREVSEQERLQLGESAIQAIGDAVAAAVLASPAHLEAMELCAGFFAVGGESSRMVAHIVRQQGVLGTVLKSQPGIRLRMAAAWAEEEAERGNFELAARLYDAALAALDDLTSSHPFEGHREWWLGYTSSVRSKAAHAQAMAGHYLQAIEIADAGRLTILAKSTLDWLPGLTELANEGHGELADALRRADVAYAETADESSRLRYSGSELPSDEIEADIRRLRQVRRERDDALQAIREKVPFQFPQTLDGASILASADDGPLIYLVPGESAGSLLMAEAGQPVIWRELPDLAWGAVQKMANGYLNAYDAHLEVRDEATWRAWADNLDDVTGWLWSAAAGPMIEALDGRPFARVVAMGPLGVLPPIHAAWVEGPDGQRRYAGDAVALSYLPSAAALMKTRSRPTSSGPGLRPLIVSDPAHLDGRPLLWSETETSSLRERFPAADELSGEAATKTRLRTALPGHDLLHLSTHGYADLANLRRSGVILADGELVTVADLRVWNTEALQLLVLSSCESALTGGVAPDEMISLPAAVFGSSGCQVIGTVWEAEQETTALIFQAFYRRWSLSTRTCEVAVALQHAMAEVRTGIDSAGYPLEHPVRWAPYILVG
jgi:hypothetical protein